MNIAYTIRKELILLRRNYKILLTIVSDVILLNLNFLICNFLLIFFYSKNIAFLRADFPVYSGFDTFNLIEILILTLISVFLIFSLSGYKSFFRSSDVVNLLGGSRILSIIVFNLLLFLISSPKLGIFGAFNLALQSLVSIFFYYFLFRSVVFKFLSNKSTFNTVPIIIYGAGQAGIETAAYLSQNEKYKVIGFIDDDKHLKNFKILGYKVFGGINSINRLKEDFPSLLIVMALVNINNLQRRRIIAAIEKFEVKVKTIPSNYGSLESKLSIENIDVTDLIDRKIVEPKKTLLYKNITDKVVLITGAGGSIGSEISAQVASLEPKKIILIDFSEFNLYKLIENFRSFKNFKKMNFILEDIRNSDHLDSIIKKEKVNTIYHAAAYKHVPILEETHNLNIAIENNFFSTFDLCNISMKNLVDDFVLISSDKAVNPPNIMGATKRLAELSLQAFQDKEENKTTFSMVRFGNVINSSGSVIPLFWEQIYSGGPVTVTHEDVNRYFMTVEEAASLVIQAGALANGGEVHLLDMGNSIRIKELAERMIRLSGNAVSGKNQTDGIKIIYSGLRPGEKIYEELLLSNDFIETDHEGIKKGIEKKYSHKEVSNLKENLMIQIKKDNALEIKSIISKYVEGFSS